MSDLMMNEFKKIGGKLNGHPTKRLAHNLNVYFPGIESKAIINSVSKEIAISAGSARTTQIVEPSHVLLALELNEDTTHYSIRIGLGRFTLKTEIDFCIKKIIESTKKIQKIKL